MKNFSFFLIITVIMISLCSSLAYAGSNKTWSNIGKGLAIYEGVKVLTGREGNIVDDVTGGMKPRKGSAQAQTGTYEDGYNSGYKQGYEEGYNAGFRQGVEHK